MRVLCTFHGKLTVNRTEAFLPRYRQEQFYQQLSAMSSEPIQSAHAGGGPVLPGPHMCQPARSRAQAEEFKKVARKFESRLKGYD